MSSCFNLTLTVKGSGIFLQFFRLPTRKYDSRLLMLSPMHDTLIWCLSGGMAFFLLKMTCIGQWIELLEIEWLQMIIYASVAAMVITSRCCCMCVWSWGYIYIWKLFCFVFFYFFLLIIGLRSAGFMKNK